MSRTLRIILLAAGAVVAVLLIVQVFGNDKKKADSTTSTTSAASGQSSVAWAGDACTALATWKADLKAEATKVRASPTKASLQGAIDTAKGSTKTLTTALAGLGLPSTAAGDEAKSTLTKLGSQLRNDIAVIQRTIDQMSGAQGSVEATATISTVLVSMRDELKAAGKSLRELQSGELEQAFKSAPECKTLNTTSTTL